ncbi:MAG: M18 family aminopeptidase [Acidobacteriota bacterium]
MTVSPADCNADLLSFIEASPTPHHCVAEARRRLESAGFTALDERERFELKPGGRYLVEREGTTLVAWIQSGDGVPKSFHLLGAHTDSPNLRLKPHPERTAHGYRQLGVEPYGGLLMGTWTDRDLGVAGRLLLRDDTSQLVRIDRPVCRVPQLAIHLNRKVNDSGLVLDKQKHLSPLIGLGDGDEGWLFSWLAEETGVDADAITGFDLHLFDVVAPTVSGMNGEFIHAPRLDNQTSCHAAVASLVATDSDSTACRGIVLYDHEEIGSVSSQGAASIYLRSLLGRVVRAAGGDDEDLERALPDSLMVSCDSSHALHPNYAEYHEPDHRPIMNGGPVLKINCNQRYATDATTAARLQACADAVGVSLQRFVSRSDLPCGSTIGPISSAQLGMPTVDVGTPILSMHSIREMGGSEDQGMMVAMLQQVLKG